MKHIPEKRSCERKTYCMDLAYSFRGRTTRFRARSINTCKDGMCFQTGYAVTPGRKITLFCVYPLPGCKKLLMPTGQTAEVKWCRALPEYEAFFYQVGVAFI